MAFDNIGYSKESPEDMHPDTPGHVAAKKPKFLICAECDLGPLGWSYGDDSYLAADRLKYSHP